MVRQKTKDQQIKELKEQIKNSKKKGKDLKENMETPTTPSKEELDLSMEAPMPPQEEQMEQIAPIENQEQTKEDQRQYEIQRSREREGLQNAGAYRQANLDQGNAIIQLLVKLLDKLDEVKSSVDNLAMEDQMPEMDEEY